MTTATLKELKPAGQQEAIVHTPGPWEIFTPTDPTQSRRVTAVVECPSCKGSGTAFGCTRKKCSRCKGTGRDKYAPPTIADGFAQECADGQEWAAESLANARLIAAAPDILAALRQIVADWKAVDPDVLVPDCINVDEHWEAAVAAIERATGLVL